MPEYPECLEKRYRALDELIDELTARSSGRNSEVNCSKRCDNAGIKLMCDFWNILKDNPDCNLKKEVQARMGLSTTSIESTFGPHRITCYVCDKVGKNSSKESSSENETSSRIRKACCKSSEPIKSECCSSRGSPKMGSDVMPLSKVLCNLKDAASFDKKCNERVNNLMAAQKQLQEQIQHLEHREKDGIRLLKEADCMWACMEDTYKKKVAESLERQNAILKELKLAELEVSKWRKNKKDLEFQLNNVNKCQNEIIERMHQKKNDIKTIKNEIEDFNKRIQNGTKDIEAAKKSLNTKKQASDKVIKNIQKQIADTQHVLAEEKKHKSQKEQEGAIYIKEAREELQKICKVLLQKKLENEDMKAERDALILEIEMLRQTCDSCQDKCKNKQQSLNEEILKVEKEIAEFKVRCVQCHECVDTGDVRKFCNDCPRCQEERNCILEGNDHCVPDPTNECVCMSVKKKFMDNVFENMYTVLERQVKTRHGKCLAETVMQCLKRSRNGKLDPETKNILQDFILNTVKKNLNLTIIGGAVKTRCEMDPETYKQLMLCLKQVKVSKAPKVDKGTVAKKDPCRRWGGASECNCPGGPKTCVCTRKAPPGPRDPAPCPEDPEDKADNEKMERKDCPHREGPCSADCGKYGMNSLVGTEVAPWVPDPCKEKSCPFSKNMRAAQCVLGPERLSDLTKVSSRLRRSMSINAEDPKTNSTKKSQDIESHPRDRIIEEVMGRYTEVTPIEKVTSIERQCTAKKSGRRKNIKEVFNLNLKIQKLKKSLVTKDLPKVTISNMFVCAPVLIKNNRYLGVSPKMETIFISKKPYSFWTSDETMDVSYENSTDDINVKIQNKVEFAFPSSKHTIKHECDNSYSKTIIHKKEGKRISHKNIGNSDILLFGRDVCKNVREIIKDVIKFDIRAKDIDYSSSVELVTVKSLLKLIVSRNKLNESNITISEKEINTKEIIERTKKHAKNMKGKHDYKDNDSKTILCKRKRGDSEKNILIKSIYGNKVPEMKSCSCETTKPLATWKISILNDDGEVEDCSTELIKTPSGELGIELDDKFFNLIGKKINGNPNNTSGVLVKDKAGYYILDFSSTKTSKDDLKIKVKKTPSGAMSIIVDKNFIENIKLGSNACKKSDKLVEIEVNQSVESPVAFDENESNDKIKTYKKLDYKQQDVNKDTHEYIKNHNNVDERSKDTNRYNKQQEKSHDLKKDTKVDERYYGIPKSEFDDNFKKNLDYYYDAGIRNVILKIESNDHFKYVEAKILRVPSGGIALEVKNNKIIENNVIQKECDGLLHLSNSDTFLLDFKQNNSNKLRNITIRKGMNTSLLIIKEQLLASTSSYEDTRKDYYNIKIKGTSNDIIDPPVMLKPTPSNNFLVIVDKEFERGYNKLIENIPKEEMVGSGILTRTQSGQYIIKLQESKENERGFNAYLVKSTSGNIKVVVSGPAFDEIRKSFSGRESKGSITSSKLFELFQTPQKNNRCNERLKNLKQKSNSDSSIFDISKTKTQQSFITDSASIKKTSSGRFSVVLDKESKKAFVNNLGNYLKKNSNSLIPIKRTNSGGIIVMLNGDEHFNGQYGSLKISSSGNVYVIMDDKNLNDTKTKKAESSNHILKKNRNPSNKAIATTCKAKPDPCCNQDKCVCEEIQNTRSDWFYSDSDRDATSYQENVSNKSGVIICDPKKYSTKADFDVKRSQSCSNKSSPYIVIKPCDKCRQQRVATCNKVTKKRSEQCFYVIDSVCPYHKNRYDTVSNELLEISGLCSNGYMSTEFELKESLEAIPSQTVTEEKPLGSTPAHSLFEQNNDYLDSLPPQLPPFLRNFSIF